MTVVWTFVLPAVVLVVMGALGRRNAASLGAVPGMPAEHQQDRVRMIRRGATVCVVVGVLLALFAAFAAFR